MKCLVAVVQKVCVVIRVSRDVPDLKGIRVSKVSMDKSEWMENLDSQETQGLQVNVATEEEMEILEAKERKVCKTYLDI